jgi:hypothetical protein
MNFYDVPQCGRIGLLKFSPVDGSASGYESCESQRKHGACGMSGEFFEPKPVRHILRRRPFDWLRALLARI